MVQPLRALVETCAEAFGVADRALALGHQVRVVPATLAKALGVGARKIKTDTRDARALSEASCRLELPTVHVPTQPSSGDGKLATTNALAVPRLPGSDREMMLRSLTAVCLAASVAWLAGCGNDQSMADLAAARDTSVMVDLMPPDTGRPADLAQGRDLSMVDAATADLTMVDQQVAPPPDLAELPDLAIPDMAIPDFAIPDLTIPDLTIPPDFRVLPDLVRLPDLTIPPDLYGIDFWMPDLAPPPDLVPPPDLAMPVGMVTGSLSAVMLGQFCMPLVPPDPVFFTATLNITNVGNIDVGPVTAMSGEILQNLAVVATFTIVPTFTNVLKPGQMAQLAITKLNNSVMPANKCNTLSCNGVGYNVAISYMGPGVPLGNRAVTGLTFPQCLF